MAGGFLVQGRDALTVDDMDLRVVTKRQPTDAELADLGLCRDPGWQVRP